MVGFRFRLVTKALKEKEPSPVEPALRERDSHIDLGCCSRVVVVDIRAEIQSKIATEMIVEVVQVVDKEFIYSFPES